MDVRVATHLPKAHKPGTHQAGIIPNTCSCLAHPKLV